MLTGKNGILTQAQNAKEKTEEATKNEKTDLAKMEDLINENVNGIEIEQVTDTMPGLLEGKGTESEPYVINSIEDLVFFSYDVNQGNTYEGKYVTLGLSLDFNSSKSYKDPFRTDYGKYGYDGELKTLLTTGDGFKPIGTYLNTNTSITDETNIPFMGIFDGNGYKIDGMRIVSEEKGKGLFGFIKNATIQNLGIEKNCIINVGISYGSIAGYALESRIENCYNKAKINASNTSMNVAGIVGTIVTNCSVINCYNNGEVIGGSNIGGIAGNSISSSIISSCYNSGNINANTTNCGGILGYNQNGIVNDCYNIATVTGSGTNIAGIVGNMNGNDAKISNSYNIGIITSAPGPGSGGAIVAAFQGGILENNYSLENTVNGSNGYVTSGINIKNDEDLKNYKLLGNSYKEDSNNINNGYPILDWQ